MFQSNLPVEVSSCSVDALLSSPVWSLTKMTLCVSSSPSLCSVCTNMCLTPLGREEGRREEAYHYNIYSLFMYMYMSLVCMMLMHCLHGGEGGEAPHAYAHTHTIPDFLMYIWEVYGVFLCSIFSTFSLFMSLSSAWEGPRRAHPFEEGGGGAPCLCLCLIFLHGIYVTIV